MLAEMHGKVNMLLPTTRRNVVATARPDGSLRNRFTVSDGLPSTSWFSCVSRIQNMPDGNGTAPTKRMLHHDQRPSCFWAGFIRSSTVTIEEQRSVNLECNVVQHFGDLE